MTQPSLPPGILQNSASVSCKKRENPLQGISPLVARKARA